MSELEVQNLHSKSITGFAPVIASAELNVLRNFAFGHWRGANRLAKLLKDHEEAHEGEEFGQQFEDGRSFATAAILMAFAAMEAGVYELQLALKTPEPIQKAVENTGLIARLNATLTHHNKPLFEKGSLLGQRVELLRRIRNNLAHAKAEWSNENAKHVSLGEAIKSAKLKLNPFLPGGEPVFPLGIMSAGVAQWAADCAKEFLNDINQRADRKPVVTQENSGV